MSALAQQIIGNPASEIAGVLRAPIGMGTNQQGTIRRQHHGGYLQRVATDYRIGADRKLATAAQACQHSALRTHGLVCRWVIQTAADL